VDIPGCRLQVAGAAVVAFDSGELQTAIADKAFKKWVNSVGKAQKRKGKRLFMPLRLALTGSTHVSLSPGCLLLPQPGSSCHIVIICAHVTVCILSVTSSPCV
jgi:hypothetical protein